MFLTIFINDVSHNLYYSLCSKLIVLTLSRYAGVYYLVSFLCRYMCS
jgi:hypothetical protein